MLVTRSLATFVYVLVIKFLAIAPQYERAFSAKEFRLYQNALKCANFVRSTSELRTDKALVASLNFNDIKSGYLVTGSGDVTELNLSESGMKDVPREFFHFRGYLRVLPLAESSRKNSPRGKRHEKTDVVCIDKANLFSSLSKIDLSHNLITSLEASPFSKVAFVKILNLSYNYLSTVHERAFTGLVQLSTLYLNNNRISSLGVGVFSDLEHLRVLDLSYNLLESLELGTFDSSKALISVNLSHNCLRHFSLKLFPNSELKTLSIDEIQSCAKDCNSLNFVEFRWIFPDKSSSNDSHFLQERKTYVRREKRSEVNQGKDTTTMANVSGITSPHVDNSNGTVFYNSLRNYTNPSDNATQCHDGTDIYNLSNTLNVWILLCNLLLLLFAVVFIYLYYKKYKSVRSYNLSTARHM